MIDPVVFAQEIMFLEDWTGKQLAPEVRLRYAEYLNQHLNTEQFRQACRAIFEENKSFPFPSLNDFMEKVHQSVQLRAQHEWNKIITFPYNPYECQYPEGLTAIGYEALRVIKGMKTVHTSPVENLTRLRTAFVEAYKAISAHPDKYDLTPPPQPALPPSSQPVWLNPHNEISDEQQALNIENIQKLRERLRFQVSIPIDPN